MNIEEIKELKAILFDVNSYRDKMNEKIEKANNLIQIIEEKINNKQDVAEEVKEDDIQDEASKDTFVAPLSQVEEKQDDVKLPQDEDKTSLPVNNNGNNNSFGMSMFMAPQEVAPADTLLSQEVNNSPVIPPLEEKAGDNNSISTDVVSTQPAVQDLQPLTPVGIDLPNLDEKNETYVKVGKNPPRAIITNVEQGKKLRNSKEQQKNIVIGSLDTKAEVSPSNDPSVEQAGESKEDINKQLESMFEQLKVETDEAKAAQLNNQIAVLTKKINTAA